MKQKVIKVGTHSLAVTVPADFVHALGINQGDMVEVETDREKGRMITHFSGVMQLMLTPGSLNKKKKNRWKEKD